MSGLYAFEHDCQGCGATLRGLSIDDFCSRCHEAQGRKWEAQLDEAEHVAAREFSLGKCFDAEQEGW